MGIQQGTEIVVPGSISNLGAGFDALSVAVQLYLRVRVLDVLPSLPDAIESTFDDIVPPGENRVETAFRLARRRFGVPAPGLRLAVSSDIPVRAGLGSSAAATIAGLRLYAAAASRPLDESCLALAREVEGHPDNAAASLLGGITVSCELEEGRVVARSWRWPSDITFVVSTPDVELDTHHARSVLPAKISLQDGVFNLQRALLLVRALETGHHHDLREALRDRWHQPARAALVPGLTEALALSEPEILGVSLSGAGPSIVALASTGVERAVSLLRDVYHRLDVPCTIRTLSAHQPGS